MRASEKSALCLHFRVSRRQIRACLLPATLVAFLIREEALFRGFTAEEMWVFDSFLHFAGYVQGNEGVAGTAAILCDDILTHFREE